MLNSTLNKKMRWIACVLCACFCFPASAGTISLSWSPSPEAAGYRVYYASQTGQYDDNQFFDVGNVFQTTISGLDECVDWHLAIKAYNGAGESPTFSNEISGWARPEFASVAATPVIQGNQFTLDIFGANFQPTAQLLMSPSPTDLAGNPLLRSDSITNLSCNQIRVQFTVDPTEQDRRAMPIGSYDLEMEVRNPDGVFKTQTTTLDVQFNPDRWDINQSQPTTLDRVDGGDLTWLAYSWSNQEGDTRFNADADLTGDGLVDGQDLAILAAGFGKCRSNTDGTWTESACPI